MKIFTKYEADFMAEWFKQMDKRIKQAQEKS